MKLRLQGNSVRLRLTRSEVERLREAGLVEESVDFGAGEALTYRLHSTPEQGPVAAEYRHGALTVSVPTEAAQRLGYFRRRRHLCAIRRGLDLD